MTNGGSESLDRIKISNSVWKKDAQLATNPSTAKANLRQNKNTKQSLRKTTHKTNTIKTT